MDQQRQRADEHALRSAWETRAELRAEFRTFEVFEAYEEAVAQGRTRLPSALSRSAHSDNGAGASSARRHPVDEKVLRAAWETRADLHAEFGTFEVFAAFERASEQGRTREPSALMRRRESSGAELAGVDENALRAAWDTRAELRAEFGNWEQLLAYEKACARGPSQNGSVLHDRASGIESAGTAANRTNAAWRERERQVVAVPLSSPAAAAVNPRGASLAEVALSLRAPVHKLSIEKAEQVLAAVGLRACSREDGELWFDRATLDATTRERDVRSRIMAAGMKHVRKLSFVGGGEVAIE